MPLTTAQQTIADDQTRFVVSCCGRRFGKTFLCMNRLAYHARLPNQRVFYIAPTYRMAKQIIWEPLLAKLTSLNWIRQVNASDLSIKLVNGSEIALRSADNPDSLRGVGLNFVAFDETADMDSSVWYEVIRPTLSTTRGKALFLGTPKGHNWFKDLFDQAATNPESWSSYQFTTLDGGQVPEDELESARRDLDSRTFEQEYMAKFNNYSGIIAYAFGDHNIAPLAVPEPKETLVIGGDFNVSPMTAVIMRRTDVGLQAIDEITIYNSNTNEMVDEIRNRYPTNPIMFYPDPAGVQRKTSANGNTDIKILENAGFRVFYHRQHPPVKDRINAANSLFHQRTDSTTRFHIDPKCKYTIKSLRGFCFKEGTQIPDKDSQLDHHFDSLTYAIEYLFPLQREQGPQVAQRFGHRLA
ncbi:Terminase-like family [uncultured Caudovirales phage]|uniref:Terminase-like family n=1 Tax=uncultured Caudovirales phage TaxID=2100421 RepID=A0A6J5LQZ3_9CAUD|nr:Terminase-like family [uncultured Caudovirales phage]CAB4154733.1 Terminase-like family [uncultured Caudovirales phage]